MKLCIAVLSSALILAGAGFAQDTSKKKSTAAEEKMQTSEKTTDMGTTKTKSHSAVGTVKEYNEGKSIVVTTAKGKDRTFDLSGNNLTANVAPGIAVGSDVKVMEKTDNSGHKTVTVEPYAKGQRSRKKTT
ncbi:MAG: hypothetical protein JWO48_2605 [Bryobacterales bacterium]|nr:hypothetical protein [Bryobacterales bacterium]